MPYGDNHYRWTEHSGSTGEIHEEVERIEKTTNGVVGLLEEMKRAMSGVKEMKQRVRSRKDSSIDMTRKMFATLRHIVDEKERQTIADIRKGADDTEKALEVSYQHDFVIG